MLIKWPHATGGSYLDGITLEPTKLLSFLSWALSHVALKLGVIMFICRDEEIETELFPIISAILSILIKA